MLIRITALHAARSTLRPSACKRAHCVIKIVGVQFRELLERLLDDDDDMRDLNLTAKCAARPPPACPRGTTAELRSSSPSISDHAGSHDATRSAGFRPGSVQFASRTISESTLGLLLRRVRQDVRMRALRSLSGAGTGTTTPTAAEVPPGYVSAFDIIQETEREKDRVRARTLRLGPTHCDPPVIVHVDSSAGWERIGFLVGGLCSPAQQSRSSVLSTRSCQGTTCCVQRCAGLCSMWTLSTYRCSARWLVAPPSGH